MFTRQNRIFTESFLCLYLYYTEYFLFVKQFLQNIFGKQKGSI
nr:MAG TPA: hypothetical protein [Caudoviricetes sp.]